MVEADPGRPRPPAPPRALPDPGGPAPPLPGPGVRVPDRPRPRHRRISPARVQRADPRGRRDREGGGGPGAVRPGRGRLLPGAHGREPLGPVTGAEGLYALTGFNGFGVMRAGGAARRLADLLTEGDEAHRPREALQPVWPGRFGGAGVPFAPKPGFTLEAGDDPRI